jgi:hypothetical protein
MRNIFYSVYIMTCISILLMGAGCSEDENEKGTVLKVERDGANFANGAGTETLAVTTNTDDWTVITEDGQTWLTANRQGDAVMLSVTESNERAIRTSYAVIKAGNRTKELIVKQLGYEADILIDPQAPQEVPSTGGTVTLKVTANVDLTVTIPATWITAGGGTTRALPMTEETYTYTVEPNMSDETRSAVLTFAETGGTFSKQVEIKQAACPPTIENVRAVAQGGAVKLTWTSLYTSRIEIDYTITDPLKGTVTPKAITVEGLGEVVIEDLRARYGEIEFSLKPFNAKGSGETVKVKQTALAAPVQTFPGKTATWIRIPVADLYTRVWTDSSHPSGDGKFEYLIDGIEPIQYSVDQTYGGLGGNYFHQNWGNPLDFPHYIVVDLGKEVSAISFYYVGRANSGAADPTIMDVLVSRTFTPVAKDGTNATNPEHVIDKTTETDEGAVLLHSYAGGDLPKSDAATNRPTRFTSEDLQSPAPFRYVWFKIKGAVYTSYQYIALSELKVFEIKPPHTYDPETEIETPLP